MSNKVTLAAGAEATLSLHGFGFYVVKSDGPVIVELREIDGSQDEAGILEAGQGLQGSSRFEAVRIINMHTTTQTIEFYVGPRTFVDNRVVGQVSVVGNISVDPVVGEYPAFSAFTGVGAGAGFYGVQQLYNPMGSGKTLYVTEYGLRTNGGGYFEVGRYDNDIAGTVKSIVAMSHSGHVSVAKAQVSAVSSQITVSNYFDNPYIKAAQHLEIRKLDKVLRLDEGQGFVISCTTSGVNTYGCITWEERENV